MPLPLGSEIMGLSPLPITNTLFTRVAKVWPAAGRARGEARGWGQQAAWHGMAELFR